MENKFEKVAQCIDDFQIELKKPFDFSFLKDYGKVFKIYQQESGNICFGISNGEKRYFIKFAGAETLNRASSTSESIERLKIAAPKYREMAHPLLINLVESKQIGDGYMLVFDWEDGESFGDQNPHLTEKFNALPIAEKVRVFGEVLRFHEYVSECGYISIDFNDNSTLYNFGNGKTIVSDIDLYTKQSNIEYDVQYRIGYPPVMAPEEYRGDRRIDEATNVFRMGATAFLMLAGGNRSFYTWSLGFDLYTVAKKAVSVEREDRQQSVSQLREEWNAAINGQFL